MSKHGPPKVSTSITFDPDQYSALAAEAEKASTSMSTVVRSLVRRWMLEKDGRLQEAHQ